MKKLILSAFAVVAFGSSVFAGENGAVAQTKVVARRLATRVVTLKPVEVKVIKVETVETVETVKAYVAGTRRTTRLRDRLITGRTPVVFAAEAPCCEKAAAAKK
jgi:predicted Zn-dependent protease